MTVLSGPRHPIVADALDLAGEWCRGQIIDGAPALGHAVQVALVLGRHVPHAPPELVAAVLLHDAPQYAPKDVDLDALLAVRLGPAVTRIMRGLQRDHVALDEGELWLPDTGARPPWESPSRRPVPEVTIEDRWVLYASAADKIVSLRSILRRAALAPDRAGYWRSRRAFVDRVPYFATFHTCAAPHLPPGMAGELARLVVRVEHVTAPRRDTDRVPDVQPAARRDTPEGPRGS